MWYGIRAKTDEKNSSYSYVLLKICLIDIYLIKNMINLNCKLFMVLLDLIEINIDEILNK